VGLWDEAWLHQRLKYMAVGGYENQVSAMVAKLLPRGKVLLSHGLMNSNRSYNCSVPEGIEQKAAA
jgi:hypothetical protein